MILTSYVSLLSRFLLVIQDPETMQTSFIHVPLGLFAHVSIDPECALWCLTWIFQLSSSMSNPLHPSYWFFPLCQLVLLPAEIFHQPELNWKLSQTRRYHSHIFLVIDMNQEFCVWDRESIFGAICKSGGGTWTITWQILGHLVFDAVLMLSEHQGERTRLRS